jgi:hypothetical protein
MIIHVIACLLDAINKKASEHLPICPVQPVGFSLLSLGPVNFGMQGMRAQLPEELRCIPLAPHLFKLILCPPELALLVTNIAKDDK